MNKLLIGVGIFGAIVLFGEMLPDKPNTTAATETKAPEPIHRDCSQPPYGASQVTYEAFIATSKLDDPQGTLQKVCIGQNFPDTEKRKGLLLYFTVKEIEETDTAELTDELLDRGIKILKATLGRK